MQQHPRHSKFFLPKPILLVAPMRSVADDGVADVCHVFAKLMKTPSERPQFDKGVAGSLVFAEWQINLSNLESREFCDSRLHSSPVIFQVVINFAGGIRPATYDGEVLFFNFSLRKNLLSDTVHLRAEGEQQHPARLPVQPMHGVYPLADLLSQNLNSKLSGILGDGGAVYQQTRGLVDGNEVGIVVYDFDFYRCKVCHLERSDIPNSLLDAIDYQSPNEIPSFRAVWMR